MITNIIIEKARKYVIIAIIIIIVIIIVIIIIFSSATFSLSLLLNLQGEDERK